MPRLTVNDTVLHYRLAGHGGPAFVLVHGGCCAASDWQQQIAALSAQGTVLAMDLRGHGKSGGDGPMTVAQWAADVNALVVALGFGPATIVGHSLGARIAAEAAWQQPSHYQGLVLLDGSRVIGGLAATRPPPGEGKGRAPGGTLAQILALTVGPYADDAVRAQVIATMGASPEPVMQACVRALEDWDRERADTVYPALELPVLAIQSTYHDRFTPRRSFADAGDPSPYLDDLRRQIPHIAVELLPQTGHFGMIEHPARVTALIRDFGAKAARP